MCSNRQTSLVNVIIKIQVDYLNLQFIIREEQTERDLYDIWDIFLSGGTYFIQIENFVRNYLFFLCSMKLQHKILCLITAHKA